MWVPQEETVYKMNLLAGARVKSPESLLKRKTGFWFSDLKKKKIYIYIYINVTHNLHINLRLNF
jgi:hypothetical protein